MVEKPECQKARKKRLPVIDLGLRKVSRMNFSDVMTLPKAFTRKFLGEERLVKVIMSDDGILKIIPIHKEHEKGGNVS